MRKRPEFDRDLFHLAAQFQLEQGVACGAVVR
jgi:hypothetical protein